MAKSRPTEMVETLSNLHQGVGSALNSVRALIQLEEGLIQAGVEFSDIQTEVAAQVEELEDSIQDLGALLAALDLDYGSTIRAAGNRLLSYFQIDVDNGAAGATITCKDAGGNTITPLGSWGPGAGDSIELIGCTDPDNNGVYVIDSISSSAIILTTTLSGDDTDDRRARIAWRIDV